MKIFINCGAKQEEIIALLTENSYDWGTYSYVGKMGLRMEFDVETEKTEEEIVNLTKQTIKAEPYGLVIFFQVTA